ncbi:hypothetical protein [Streptomyces sp. NBC_01506]|uniref:hypothetical protein n=1 Tax=Streptomyces sp. NBC_01506 TaxID=2903887 RepID=UPI00386AE223
MDEGLERALSARTWSDLAPALDSLPQEKAGTAATIGAAGGRIKRRGAWRVPRPYKEEPRTVWKDPRYRPRRPSGPAGPTIRISGAMGYARLEVRHAWR